MFQTFDTINKRDFEDFCTRLISSATNGIGGTIFNSGISIDSYNNKIYWVFYKHY